MSHEFAFPQDVDLTKRIGKLGHHIRWLSPAVGNAINNVMEEMGRKKRMVANLEKKVEGVIAGRSACPPGRR